MDDDEDVPTTVAMREQLDVDVRPAAMRSAGRGPAFPPASPQGGGSSPASYAGNPTSYAASASPASYAANAGRGPGYDGRAPAPTFGGGGGAYGASQGYGAPAGFGSQQGSEDLGSTVALPSNLGIADQGRPPGPVAVVRAQYGAPPSANGQAPGFGGFPQGGPAPRFGQPQGNPVLTPAGMVGGVPMGHYPMPQPSQGGQHGQPNGPQSQIETALSLPRPDPAALWLAQQEKQKGRAPQHGRAHRRGRRSRRSACSGSARSSTSSCGRARHAAATPDSPPALSVAAVSGEAPAGADTAAAATSATAAVAAVAAAPTASATAAAAATANAGAASAPSKPGKEEPGFLTIVCNPSCDDVNDQGKSLGPAPIVHLSVAPGPHRVTVRKGRDTKVISLIVVAGQVTAQRVSMK